MTETVRTMVTIRTIDKVTPIPDADRIEAASIGGWTVVVGKDAYEVGDKVLYFEIDSFLPGTDPRFEEFLKRGTKTVTTEDGDEVTGHVLKTIRLRGVYSQGLIMRISDFGELSEDSSPEEVSEVMRGVGVFKYEPPIPAALSGQILGAFPRDVVEKTDAERVQNLSDEFLASCDPSEWVATEKIDGTSVTYIMDVDGLRLCSRNWELAHDGKTTYSQVASQLGLEDVMPVGSVIQGEVYGEGIQKNSLKVKGVRLAVFNTVGIEDGSDAAVVVDGLRVPRVDLPFPFTVDEAVRQVDGIRSVISPKLNAEGVVWWNVVGNRFDETGGRSNFKAINNKWLLKND